MTEEMLEKSRKTATEMRLGNVEFRERIIEDMRWKTALGGCRYQGDGRDQPVRLTRNRCLLSLFRVLKLR